MVTESRLPQLTMKIWDGDPDERFTHMDMNRVCFNTNIVAEACGVRTASFPEVLCSDQFRYDYAQILEEMVAECAETLGIQMTTDTTWGYGRSLSHVDFERWESNLFALYTALGGIGDRIPSEKHLHTVSATLFPASWIGQGPYHQDIVVPSVHPSSEALVYLSETASDLQQVSAFNALLQATLLSDRVLRIHAHSVRPGTTIPIKITSRPFDMIAQFTLTQDSWTGTGPWTQIVDIGAEVANAVVGSDERNDAQQMEAFATAIIGVSAIDGTTVTLRAVGERPAMDLYASVMWSTGSVV